MRWVVCCLLLAGQYALADVVVPHEAEVEYLGQRQFHLKFQFFVRAGIQETRRLLTDYEQLKRLNSSIVESTILGQTANGVTRVKTVTEGCILFLCKQVILVEDVRETRDNYLESDAVPELSDVEYAHAKWFLMARDSGTEVIYETHMKVKFWLPPFIGPAVVKRKLEKNIIETARNMERLLQTSTRQE